MATTFGKLDKDAIEQGKIYVQAFLVDHLYSLHTLLNPTDCALNSTSRKEADYHQTWRKQNGNS
jgi:hypothetical protein